MINQIVPQPLHSISHPLIRDIYLKKDTKSNRDLDILVLETYELETEEDNENFDSYLMDILTDLEDLKEKAQREIGFFDRIDIHTH